MKTIVCIADTHMNHPAIPGCDLLIHAGDLTNRGTLEQVSKELTWLATLPAKKVVLVPGNHDFLFERDKKVAIDMADDLGIRVLMDEGMVWHGYNIYGAPWQPWFHDWAFNAPQDQIEGRDFLAEKWGMIPADTDILITHCPPRGDVGGQMMSGNDIGCVELTRRVVDLTNLRAHVYGHCHQGYGVYPGFATTFVNAAICNEQYQAVNNPITLRIK